MRDLSDDRITHDLPATDFANQQMSYDLGGFLETLYICSHQPEVARQKHGAEYVAEMQAVDISLANYCRTRLAGNIAAIEVPLMASLKVGGDFLYHSPFFHADRFIHQRILYGYWRQNLSGNEEDFETNQTLLARLEELRILGSVLSKDQFYKKIYRHRVAGYYDDNDNRLLDDGRQQYIKPTRKATREWRISCIAYVLGIGRVTSTISIGRGMEDLGRVLGRELASWSTLIDGEFNTKQHFGDFNFNHGSNLIESWDNVAAFDPHKM